MHRTFVALVLLLLLALSVHADEPKSSRTRAAVRQALADALEALSLTAEDVQVRDLLFWKGYEGSLRSSGRMTEGCRLPLEHDPLRPHPIDRVLRRPLDAVDLALDFHESGEGWRHAWRQGKEGPGGEPPPIELDLGSYAPIVADAWNAYRSLETELALPELTPEERDRLAVWALDGIPASEISMAREVFDRFRAEDVYVPRQAALDAVEELAKTARTRSKARWPRKPVRLEAGDASIVIGTRGKDTYVDDATLVIDPGGNDVYRARAAFIIDLAGDDRYEAKEPFAQGAAHMGVSVLLDLEGDDHYETSVGGQGAVLGGVAIHADWEGDDTYVADRYAQGAAFLGAALLWDREGDDTYRLASSGQGFGRTGGIGLLVDEEGRDRYEAGGTYESFYSQWMKDGKKVYWSWAQGCGLGFYGRYEQPTADGGKQLVIHGLFPGGVGYLHDGAGDDEYIGSMWAQGTGYFYSLGLLHDVEGDDRYVSEWYGQGASAHFAAGILIDGEGNDRYQGLRQTQGNGRDFSTAVCLDLAGNDVYTAMERSQGCGDVRDGYGILVDVRGKDEYDAEEASCRGFATKLSEPPSERIPFHDVGLFLDLGGKDVYRGAAKGKNDSTWIQEATRRGVGVDR